MTGRGLGFCGGYDSPGWTRGGGFAYGGRGGGRGWGRGGGRGWGWRSGPWWGEVPPPAAYPAGWDREPSLTELQAQAKEMTRALEDIQNRIRNMESSEDADR